MNDNPQLEEPNHNPNDTSAKGLKVDNTKGNPLLKDPPVLTADREQPDLGQVQVQKPIGDRKMLVGEQLESILSPSNLNVKNDGLGKILPSRLSNTSSDTAIKQIEGLKETVHVNRKLLSALMF